MTRQWMRLYRLARDGRAVQATGAWRLRPQLRVGRDRHTHAAVEMAVTRGQVGAAVGLAGRTVRVSVSWYRPVAEASKPVATSWSGCHDFGTGGVGPCG